MMRTCSLILAVALLAACGQKGPLYRADEKAQEVPASQNSTDNPASTDQKKKTPAFPPAPQSQKVPQSPPETSPPKTSTPETSTPTDPTPAPPAVDPDRPATPPPGN